MKTHTNNFKTAIKTFGRELDSKITYTLNGTTVELGTEDLNSITPHYEGGILKSVMRQLDIDSNTEIPLGTILTYQFGVKVGNAYEYINFGTYIVYNVEKQEDTRSYKITCYDKMLYSMKDYEDLNITYPITIRNYINAICTHLGLTFKNASGTFANYDKQIPNELYLDEDGKSLGYTFRDVLDELAEVTASTICINEADNQLEVRYITNTNDTIDEEFLKDVNVNFGEKFGAVNTIVLSRSAGADNIYYPSTLPQNPIEIKISDNQIMNGNDRDTYMPDIYNKLNGLEYYINDFSSTGICYYNLCDRYNVSIDGTTYSCVMFNDEVNVTQGLEEMVYTDMPEDTETDYKKSDSTDRRINITTLTLNKQQHEIEALVDTTQDIEKEINPTKNLTGTSFHLTDSTDAELVNFEMEGKTTQETRTSTNYFNAMAISNTNIVVSNEGKTITMPIVSSGNGITGTGTNLKTLAPNLKVGDVVYLYANTTSNGNKLIYLIGSNSIWNFNTQRTITQSDLDSNVSLYANRYTSGETMQVIITDLRIVFNQNNEWMPFGNMPSPNYPSELVSVGYQNLYEGSQDFNGTWNNNSSWETDTEEYNGLIVKKTSQAWNGLSKDISIESGKTYTFSLYAKSTTSRPVGIYLRGTSGQITNVETLTFNTTTEWQRYYLTFIATGSGILRPRLENTTTVSNNYTYIAGYQIEESSVMRSYLSYGKYGIEIKTRGNNLLKGMSTPRTDKYWYDATATYFTPLEDGWGKFEINNTSGSSTVFINAKVRAGQIDLKPNTLYTIVAEIRNGNVSANSGCFFQLCTANPTASWQTAKAIDYNDINTGGTYLLTSTTKTSLLNATSYFDSYLRIAAGYSGSLEIRVSLIEGTYSLDNFEYEPYKRKDYLYTLNEPLRSVEDVKDLLYIKNNMLYVDRKIGSQILDGTETWNLYSSYTGNGYCYWTENNDYGLGYSTSKSNYFTNKIAVWGYTTSEIGTYSDHPTAHRKYFISAESTVDNFKTWLGTHNVEVDYILEAPYTEELGKVEMPSTYKSITYIDTTYINEPTMNITYVRDTQITNYVEEHISQIVINEEGITQRVQTIEDSDYDSKINAIETKQTSTDLTIDIISTNIDRTTGNVNAVTTREKNFTFNDSGLNIASSDNTFSSKIDEQGLVFKNGDTTVAEYTKDGSKQKDLSLFGVYYYGMDDKDDTPMFVAQLYTDKNGEECFGHFYNRGD